MFQCRPQFEENASQTGLLQRALRAMCARRFSILEGIMAEVKGPGYEDVTRPLEGTSSKKNETEGSGRVKALAKQLSKTLVPPADPSKTPHNVTRLVASDKSAKIAKMVLPPAPPRQDPNAPPLPSRGASKDSRSAVSPRSHGLSPAPSGRSDSPPNAGISRNVVSPPLMSGAGAAERPSGVTLEAPKPRAPITTVTPQALTVVNTSGLKKPDLVKDVNALARFIVERGAYKFEYPFSASVTERDREKLDKEVFNKKTGLSVTEETYKKATTAYKEGREEVYLNLLKTFARQAMEENGLTRQELIDRSGALKGLLQSILSEGACHASETYLTQIFLPDISK